MNRLHFILLVFGFSQISAGKPNVVFFLVDDLGWSDVACYGSSFYETPHIDQLAKEGVKFTSGYAACHVCSPTRASILTGKYPATMNLTEWLNGRSDRPYQILSNPDKAMALDPKENTLAEVLKKEGYATALFGKWHLGRDKPPPPCACLRKGWPTVRGCSWPIAILCSLGCPLWRS